MEALFAAFWNDISGLIYDYALAFVMVCAAFWIAAKIVSCFIKIKQGNKPTVIEASSVFIILLFILALKPYLSNDKEIEIEPKAQTLYTVSIKEDSGVITEYQAYDYYVERYEDCISFDDARTGESYKIFYGTNIVTIKSETVPSEIEDEMKT